MIIVVWLILATVGVVEWYIASFAIKSISLLPRGWLRWPAWGFLVLLMTYGLFSAGVLAMMLAACFATSEPWWYLLLPARPRPTARLLLLGASTLFWLFFLALGLAGLRRDSANSGLPRARSWPISKLLLRLSACVALLLAVVAAQDWWLSRQIHELRAKASQIAERAAPRPGDESNNAALLYAALKERFAIAPPPTESLGEGLERLREEAWKQYLAEHAEVAAEMREIARLPGCRMERDWSRASIFDESPEFDHVALAAGLLRPEGHRAIFEGNVSLAFENAVALRRLAEQWSQDPRSRIQISAFKADGQAAALIEHALSIRNPTQQEMEDLVRPDFSFRDRLPRAQNWAEAEHYNAIGEMYVEGAGRPAIDGVPGAALAASAGLFSSRLVFAADDVHTVPRQFAELQRLAALPDKVAASLPQSGSASPYAKLAHSPGGNIAFRMVPIQFTFMELYLRADATRRIADLALRVSQRQQIAAIVDSGAENAVPSADRPIDPFSGEPLKIVAADGGVIVYSVGPNRVDDGGAEPESRALGDIPIVLGAAFQRRRVR